MIELSKSQREDIYRDFVDHDGDYIQIDEYDIGMDNHGQSCVIVVFKQTDNPLLYGFMVRKTGDEEFFDDETIFVLNSRQVIVTKYNPITHESWFM